MKSHSDASDETIDSIMQCSSGDEGIQLHHEYGVQTESLVPEQTYVPWVTFNHVSIEINIILCTKFNYIAVKILSTSFVIRINRNIPKTIHLRIANLICLTAFVKTILVEFQNA